MQKIRIAYGNLFLLLDQDIFILLISNECPRAFEQNSIK